MRDIALGSTIYIKFTTRAFATGVPTTLAGTPVLSIYEENNLTQITTGVSLTVDYDSVTGLNQVAIIATLGNGYESGKSYDLVITVGTVGGVSVIGEVVGSFTVGSSAAFARLGIPVGVSIAADIAAIKSDTAEIGIAGVGLTNIGTIAAVTDLTNLPTMPANWLTSSGIAASAMDGKGDWNIGKAGYSISGTLQTLDNLNNFDPVNDTVANVTLVTSNADMRGTDGANIITPDNNGIALTLLDTTAIKGGTFSSVTDSLAAIRDRGDSAWITGAGGSSPTVEQIRQEMDTNSAIKTETSQLLTNVANIPTIAEFEARTPSPAELKYITDHAKTAKPVTFTGGTTTTAILGNVDGVAASSVDSAYKSRLLVFNIGTLDVQVTDIVSYIGSTKVATITAVTTAVTLAHTAMMV